MSHITRVYPGFCTKKWLWVFLLLIYCTELTKSKLAAWILANLEHQTLLEKPCGEGQKRDCYVILFHLLPTSFNVNIFGTFAWVFDQNNHASFEANLMHMLLTHGEETIISILYDVPPHIPILIAHDITLPLPPTSMKACSLLVAGFSSTPMQNQNSTPTPPPLLIVWRDQKTFR